MAVKQYIHKDAQGNQSTHDLGADAVNVDVSAAAAKELGLAEQETDLETVLQQTLPQKLDKDGDASDTTVAFTAAASRANLTTGEKLSVAFGKIAKWFADLKTVAFTGKYSDLTGTPSIPTSAADVGADEAGAASGAVSTHNSSTTAHQTLFDKKANKSTKVSATISTTWTGSAAPYTQNIAVAGATATNVIEVKLPSSATQAQIEAYRALILTDGGQSTGSITIKAWGEKNTISIPVEIIVRGDL